MRQQPNGEPSGKHWIVTELLKIARERGRSLEDVAADAGRNRNTLYDWNRLGAINPTIDTVDKVAEALGYELELIHKG
ncbi:MAG: helix-turn-helix transcriptional regulator [Alphaproteobacteria bacterium]